MSIWKSNKVVFMAVIIVIATFSWLNWWFLPNFVVGYIETVEIMRGWAAVCELILPLLVVFLIGGGLGCYIGRLYQDDLYFKTAENHVNVAQIEKTKALKKLESWKFELLKEMSEVIKLREYVESKDLHINDTISYLSDVANNEKALREEAERKLKKEREVYADKEKKLIARLQKDKPKKD
jgi:hypothetical protein